tara:strand:+ start:1105 stop:3624 length:2520 start_codon:yes stop_codon:yes gene_type:complete
MSILKKTITFDLNLFSGSSESIRQAVKGYYNQEEANMFFEEAIMGNIFKGRDDRSETNFILPRRKYSNRIAASLDTSIRSDDEWKKFLLGGSFADMEYPGLYNTRTYADHANVFSLPYLPREIIGTDRTEGLSLTTEYYNYYPRFQAEVDSLESELMAPNYYFLGPFLSPASTPNSTVASVQYPDIKHFLSFTYVNREKTINEALRNLFVMDVERLDELKIKKHVDSPGSTFDEDLTKLYSLMPFGNKLEIDSAFASQGKGKYDFRGIIEENEYEVRFLELLKEIFQGEATLEPTTVNFGLNLEQISSTGIVETNEETIQTVPLRVVDAPTMLLYASDNPTSETNDITVLRPLVYASQTDDAFDTTGVYRYENTEKSLSVLSDFVSKIEEKFDDARTEDLGTFLNQAGESKYYEPVAFRVQKIGGGPTGDDRTENTVQNIWFYNRNKAITYLDTQVKYDTDYTYKIFCYVLVQGYKYATTDMVVTRQIATTSVLGNRLFCLEFYDPITGQTSPSLIGDHITTEPPKDSRGDGPPDPFGSDSIFDPKNPFTGDAQVNSSVPYLADFNIIIEPSLQILEVPIEQKRMRIVDHPPNDFVATPHHLKDQSNRLAFYLKYDTFSKDTEPYPSTLTPQDLQNKDAYLEGKDFLEISKMMEETASRADTIEVYRTETRPTSYQGFEGSLRDTIALRQSNGDIVTDHLFVERVRENTKYYYVFRALNQNGVAGEFSPIFEAELINDGGYVYGKFEQFSEEEMALPPPKEPLLPIKKLINILPNIQHLQLDTSEVDFSEASVDQLENVSLASGVEDPIWTKTFKVRLTSKKTGRKIDLNIHFNREVNK